jgi:wyosine [tRNA(Phe)-imidazoG37] synthetase (radical SAM superfamily)
LHPGIWIGYLTFVPDGEPTLDLNLGRTIGLLRPLDIKIAVITNSSLLWMPEVRDDLARADWVGLKVDSVREKTWRKIGRPNAHLQLRPILDGMRAFCPQLPRNDHHGDDARQRLERRHR